MNEKPNPWSPYRPSAVDPWDLRKVAHLHRRAGFGANWSELQRDLKTGPAASVGRLLQPRPFSGEESLILDSLRQGVLDSRDAERLKAWWLYRVLYDPDPLREKLTLFWHGHFATSNRKVESVGLMLRQNELLRRHALGDLPTLLKEITADGAMLAWLDGANSKKAKPNENYAREFLELFTVGVGHFSEADVRAAARAFTGWRRERSDEYFGIDSFPFEPSEFDAGVKTFLKQTGAWKADDIIRITLAEPAAAEFLCRKLYGFFVSESAEPGPELLQPLAAELRNSQYSVRHIVGVILRSRHFYAETNHRQRVAGPVEFAAGLLRVLDVPRGDVSLLALAAACERLGQDLFYPPNVKGWDGGRSWLTSATLLERGNWINDVLWGNADLGLKPFEPLDWAKRNGVTPQQTLEKLIELLLQGDLTAQARATILRAGPDGRPDNLRKGLQLILNCPQCQLV